MSYRIRQRTISEFGEWAEGRGIIPAQVQAAKQWRERIEILLDGRADYLGKPDATLWKSGDVYELFMVHAVTRQWDGWDLAGQAPSAVREFLCFLDETQRLHPSSTRVSTLLKELDRLTPGFPAAMADSSRWRLAKRVFTAMVSDGVDIQNDAEVDRWAQRFSALRPAQRHGLLGELMDANPGYGTGALLIHEGQVALFAPGAAVSKDDVWPDASGACPDVGEYPPVALPGKPELAQMVASYGSSLLRQLVTFGRWAGGDGRPVGKRGELSGESLRDAAAALGLPSEGVSRRHDDLPALDRLWRMSLDFGLLALRRTRVISGPALDHAEQVVRGEAQPDDALTLWADLYDELLSPSSAPAQLGDTDALRKWLQPWAPRFLGLLYAHAPGGGWSSLDDLTATLLGENAEMIPPADPEIFTELAAGAVRQPLAVLAGHGAVEVIPQPAHLQEQVPGPAQEAACRLGTQPWVLFPVPGIQVRLTELGKYVVRERLLAEGARVPLAGTEDARPFTPARDASVPAVAGGSA